MKFFSKTIFFLVIFLLIFNSLGYSNKSGFLKLAPNKAGAVFSTIPTDVGIWISNRAVEIVKWIKDNYEKIMRDIIAKRIMDYIVDQTVQWIQGGGEPKFVTNWDSFMKDAGDIAFDSVIREIGAAGLCSPFGLQVKLALLPVQKFSTQISCTLDKVVKNINNFYVDFSVGGWDGYLLSLEPQNNFYGAMLLANDKLVTEIKKSQEKNKKEAEMGSGFLGVKRCKQGSEVDSSTQGPGFVKDANGNYCDSKNLETTTPGNVVGAAVGSAVTSDTQWAANIESWVSALANALINRLLKEGLTELSKSNPNASPDYYPSEYASARESYYEQDKERMISEVRRVAAGGGVMNNDTSDLTQETLTYVSSTLAMLKEMQSLGCSVDTDEITTTQSEVNNLSAQSENNADGASEADSLISDIQTTDPSDTVAWQSILDRYDDFISRDQNFNNLTTGVYNQYFNPQGDAQTKLTTVISENNAVSARLLACKSPIVINNGANTTTNVDVSLKLNATSSISGINNVSQMMTSNDSNFLNAVWETYSTTKSWVLTAGTGLKTVYVKFRNASGNESNAFNDDIILQ